MGGTERKPVRILDLVKEIAINLEVLWTNWENLHVKERSSKLPNGFRFVFKTHPSFHFPTQTHIGSFSNFCTRLHLIFQSGIPQSIRLCLLKSKLLSYFLSLASFPFHNAPRSMQFKS